MRIFADIFADPEQPDGNSDSSNSEDGGDWLHQMDAVELHSQLHSAGYTDAESVAQQLYSLSQSKAVLGLDAEPRSRLERLMPMLIAICATANNNSITLSRVIGLVQAVLRRSAYLALLGENPKALQQLTLLCERSSWVADQLTAYPALLDELLDPRALYTAPNKDILQDHLRQHMLRVPDDDLEQQMEIIRYFVRSYTLRVAACELTDVMPLMQVSDYLTWLAEVVIEHTVNISWKHLTDQYGQPRSSEGQVPGFYCGCLRENGRYRAGLQVRPRSGVFIRVGIQKKACLNSRLLDRVLSTTAHFLYASVSELSIPCRRLPPPAPPMKLICACDHRETPE